MQAEDRDLLYRFFGPPQPPPIPEPGSGEDPTHGRRRLCVTECKSVDADVTALNFLGSWEGEPGPQRLGLGGEICWIEPVATPLGGFRWWWICPQCGARRKALYLPAWFGAAAACRVCHGLSYRLAQTNRRTAKRGSKLERELGLPGIYWGRLDSTLRTLGRQREAHERRLRYRRKRARVILQNVRETERNV